MIGCGHVEAGVWRFESFVVDAFAEPEEARIIEGWLAHMEQVRRRLVPQLAAPRLIHWSQAEVSFFERSYDSAKARQRRPDWPSLNWFDFLQRVVRAEPVVVRGTLAFGLKAVAKAMHTHGLIETLWRDGPTDGLGAMVGAWWCAEEAQRTGVPMSRIDLMQDIICYNEGGLQGDDGDRAVSAREPLTSRSAPHSRHARSSRGAQAATADECRSMASVAAHDDTLDALHRKIASWPALCDGRLSDSGSADPQ